MPELPNQALLIFIKNPEKGAVKTRLAATLGDDKALEIYQQLLAYTRKVTKQVPVDRQVWYSRFIDGEDEWDNDHFIPKKQRGASLGPRMKNAFAEAFAGGYQQVVIIGSDCAQLQPVHLQQAYEELKEHEIVIGPSEDGGYYLLGMSRFLPMLFEGKPWSTNQVFQETVEELKRYKLRYSVLEELNDVDTEADWKQLRDKF